MSLFDGSWQSCILVLGIALAVVAGSVLESLCKTKPTLKEEPFEPPIGHEPPARFDGEGGFRYL